VRTTGGTGVAARGPGRRRYISSMVEVRLRAVRVDLQSNTPVLLLQETEGDGRTLPIFIGTPEAAAIAYALQGVAMPRPMTHDLIRDVLESLGTEVERVVVTELRSSTYYAELQLRRGTDQSVVSCRPSDAVAVAVRTGSPLYVSDELMDAEGIMLAIESSEDEDDASPEELVGQFRQFLDSIKPEDFGS
jgi:bifunctional DNase/RNase